MSDHEPWVSNEDVARHIGMFKGTVYRWIEARSLLAHMSVRLWKFMRPDIDDRVRAGGARHVEGEER